MDDMKRGPLHAVGRVLTQIVVAIYLVVDSLLSPIFRPFMRWLSSLHLVKWIESAIAAAPPYVVLCLLAVPFGVEEVVKFYGIVLMGAGHFKSGLVLYIGAHVFAILFCERIFRAGKDQLLKIAWFARLYRWFEGYKDRAIAWFKSTAAYETGRRLKAQIKEAARQALSRTKAAFGR